MKKKTPHNIPSCLWLSKSKKIHSETLYFQMYWSLDQHLCQMRWYIVWSWVIEIWFCTRQNWKSTRVHYNVVNCCKGGICEKFSDSNNLPTGSGYMTIYTEEPSFRKSNVIVHMSFNKILCSFHWDYPWSSMNVTWALQFVHVLCNLQICVLILRRSISCNSIEIPRFRLHKPFICSCESTLIDDACLTSNPRSPT